MKKTLILASVLVFAASAMCYAQDTTTATTTTKQGINAQARPDFQRPQKGPDFKKRNAEFEKRLKLTDEQKAQAEQIRKQGFEKMKPVMEKIKQKQIEIGNLKDTGTPEQIEQLKKEKHALMHEAHEIRMQNMKEFETILTDKQKKELKKIKEEGRKKFEQQHRPRPNFGGMMPPPPKEEK